MLRFVIVLHVDLISWNQCDCGDYRVVVVKARSNSRVIGNWRLASIVLRRFRIEFLADYLKVLRACAAIQLKLLKSSHLFESRFPSRCATSRSLSKGFATLFPRWGVSQLEEVTRPIRFRDSPVGILFIIQNTKN